MLIFKVGSVADTFGVHRNTVRNWIKKGILPAKPTIGKKYLIDEDDFTRFFVDQGISEIAVMKFVQGTSSSVYGSAGNVTGAMTVYGNGKTKSVTTPKQKEVPMAAKPNGSVLIVGGGISGIQAALDLADSGYYVYLIEKGPGIGGAMAKLDKTFPTNDCAM
jgi:excisionase family DNA binding protein